MRLLLFALSVLFISCSTGPTKRTSGKRVDLRPTEPLVNKTPIPAANGDQLLRLGQKAYAALDYQKAFDYFTAAKNSFVGIPAKEMESQFWTLRSLSRLNHPQHVVDLANSLLAWPSWNDQNLLEIVNHKARAQDLLQDFSGQVETYLNAANNPKLQKDRELFKLKSIEIIEAKLSADDLEKFINSPELGARALYRLGDISLENRDQDSARKYFSRVVSTAPGTDLATRANEVLQQLESIRRVAPKTIGVVLPMTGKYASISQKHLRAIQLGLGIYGKTPSTFKLAVVDSEGNPDHARRGVDTLIKEDNVIAIIGSVLSKTAPAVASRSAEMGVPTIALSQKSGITEVGSAVFRNSLTSEMQVRFLAKTAIENLGLRRFAILYPNDPYGVEYANLFWDEVLARGGSVTGVQAYSPKETDFKAPIQRLVGTFYLEGRSDEYKILLKEWSNSQTKKSARNSPPEDLLPPVVDFDAIFIPDSAKSLGQISAMLAYNGVKNVHLLGTNLWHVPNLNKRVGNSLNPVVFVDSFVASDPQYVNSKFVQEYKSFFAEDPGVMEVQAYDSALLLRQLITEGATSRESLIEALGQTKNFPGALGALSVSSDREILRPLISLTLDAGQIVPLTTYKKN